MRWYLFLFFQLVVCLLIKVFIYLQTQTYFAMSHSLSKLYYLNIGDKGTFSNTTNNTFTSTPADVDDIFQNLEAKNTERIVLYFHGGLVSRESGLETATRITAKVANLAPRSHPVSFVWQTSLWDTISQNLGDIANSEFFKHIVVKVLKVAGDKLGIHNPDLAGISRSVNSLSDPEIRAELDKEEPFANYEVVEGSKSASVITAQDLGSEGEIDDSIRQEIQASLEELITADPVLQDIANAEKPDKEARLLKPYALNQDEEEEVKSRGIINTGKLLISAVKITVNVVRRFIQHRDHDFYPTVVEEILREFYVSDAGLWLWGEMKQKAASMWAPDNFEGDYNNWHAGTYFLKKLEEYKVKKPNLIVDLVGHSAGSIVICALLNKIRGGSSLRFRNVIFLAPAVRCDTFVNEAIPDTNNLLFQQFRSFTMADENEKKDHVAGFVYPRSLLYLISGILEKESDAYIFGLQRHTEGRSPYTGGIFNKIVQFLAQNNNVVYSVNNIGNGLSTEAVHHGDFDNDDPTLKSIMFILNQ